MYNIYWQAVYFQLATPIYIILYVHVHSTSQMVQI